MNLLANYDSSKTLSEQRISSKPSKFLTEAKPSPAPVGKKEKNVQDAYNLIVGGSSGPGTDAKKIVDGVNMMNDVYELSRLLTLFQDKRTGYDTFDKMIDTEFGEGLLGFGSNQPDLDLITAKLKRLGLNYSGAEKIGVKFNPITFTPINNPLTDDVVQVAAAKAAEKEAAAKAAATPESENKENWDKVVEYYEGDTDPNWKHEVTDTEEISGELYEYIKVISKDPNDEDFYMRVYDDGDVSIWNKGPRTGYSRAKWEWDGTKPVIKFKNISKNASGYVQSTDTDWSAVTEDNRIIGLYAQGPLVKQVQNKLINYGYSGTTSGSITTDVEGCKADVEKCDGIYGKSTKAMVKQYQEDNGLDVDGIVGQQTYDSMF